MTDEIKAPSDKWLQDGSLLYRLNDERHPSNRDEVKVTMAGGDRSTEALSLAASALLKIIAANQERSSSAAVGNVTIPAAASAALQRQVARMKSGEELAAKNAEIARLIKVAQYKEEVGETLRDALAALTAKLNALVAENEKLEALCEVTYVAKGADAYHHACETLESWQEKRIKEGKESGCVGSLCGGMEWLYLKGRGHYWRVNCFGYLQCGDTYAEFDRWALCDIEEVPMPRSRSQFRIAVRAMLDGKRV